MINKKLLVLVGKEKKYMYYTVALMITRLFANIATTASICFIIYLSSKTNRIVDYIMPSLVAVFSIIVRFVSINLTSRYKDILARKVKKDIL